jgi:LacI family transcriptional regulator, gluconate utilization system Gnt-I transcriptional repressor
MAERSGSKKTRTAGPIRHGRYRMTDVAEAAGVSAMTVSRALKNDGPVSPETRDHVLRIVAQLGYVPDLIAGGLSSKRSGFVAVLVPSLNNPHFADTVGGLAEVLQPAGLQVLIGHTDYCPDQEERLLETMLRRRPEVVVLTFDGHTTKTRRLLDVAGVPVIEIWETPRNPIGHVVGFSNRKASRALGGQMIAKGYTKIAFIGESQDKGTRGSERRQGVRDALKAAGLDWERVLSVAPPPISMSHGATAVVEVMRRWPDTDAVICVSDPCAFGAMTECQRRGWTVPGRLAIAGFGDFEISRCALPAITTVAVDAAAIARKTGELILELRAADQRGKTLPRQIIEISAMPVERGSS